MATEESPNQHLPLNILQNYLIYTSSSPVPKVFETITSGRCILRLAQLLVSASNARYHLIHRLICNYFLYIPHQSSICISGIQIRYNIYDFHVHRGVCNQSLVTALVCCIYLHHRSIISTVF